MLAQTSSESSVDATADSELEATADSELDSQNEVAEKQKAQVAMFLEMQDRLKGLQTTQETLHEINHGHGKSKGTATPQQVGTLAKKLGIEVHGDVSHLGSNEAIANHLAQTMLAQVQSKKSLQHAAPESVQLLQLNEGSSSQTEERIFLEQATSNGAEVSAEESL